MAISYDYYNIFYYVGKYLSFSKAAQVMQTSQPNVTRAMKNLETALGCKLFFRNHRGVTFTREGEELYRHVQVAHKQFRIAEESLQSVKEMKSGVISVGFSIGITDQVMREDILPALRSFNEQYPGVRFNVFNDSTLKLISNVNDGVIDLAIITAFEKKDDSHNEKVLKSFNDVLIAGNSFARISEMAGVVSLSAIIDQPIVSLHRHTETYKFYNEWFSKQGLSFEPEIEVTTTNQVLEFVKADMGIGFLSEEFVRDDLNAGYVREIKIKEEIPARSITIMRDHDSNFNKAAERLEEVIVESIKK